MRDLGPELERRAHVRQQPNVACELFLGAQRHEATILDVSRGGVFVSTDAQIPPSALVRVRLDGVERFAVPVHERQVPPRLRELVPRGIGLRWMRGAPSR